MRWAKLLICQKAFRLCLFSNMSNKPNRRWRPLNEGAEPSKPSKSRVGVERRPVPHPRNPGHVYVSKKTPFKAQLETCAKQMLEGEAIVLHASGAAIPRCINLALQLVEKHHGAWSIQANTSTVDVIDDIVPQDDEGEYKSVARPSSSIHIRLYQQMSVSA